MKIKSLLVTLGILGSSSVALAEHFHEPRNDHTLRYFDDRGRDDGFRRHTTWVPLTSQMRQFGARAEIDVSMHDRFGQGLRAVVVRLAVIRDRRVRRFVRRGAA